MPANGLRGNPQTARNSHFPTAATAAGLRLHFQCFLKLGAQVVVSVRRIVLHLPKTSWLRPWSLFVLARWCEQNL